MWLIVVDNLLKLARAVGIIVLLPFAVAVLCCQFLITGLVCAADAFRMEIGGRS
jgi:hypothetical protein